MAYTPISGVVPQLSRNAGGASASGYYLKGYAAGTSTPLSMGIDSTPTSTLVKCRLNSTGYPISNDSDETTVFIPYFNASYKLVLYVNSADADANTTANAAWVVDNIAGEFDSTQITYRANTTVAQFLGNLTVDSIQSLVGVTIAEVSDGDAINVVSYFTGWASTTKGPIGGQHFVWDANYPKSNHDGGNTISSTVPWSATQIDFMDAVGETASGGNGCWRAIDNDDFYASRYGVKFDGVKIDTGEFNRCIVASAAAHAVGPSDNTTKTNLILPSGVLLAGVTIEFKPFVNYLGARATTADTDASFTTFSDSRCTIIRQHTDLYNNDTSSGGVLVYVPTGDLTIRNINFVGTQAITGNPSIGMQWGGRTTSGGRTHETSAQNVGGVDMSGCRLYTFSPAFECVQLNDTTVSDTSFESNTVSIQMSGKLSATADSGTTDGTTTSKLVDSTQNFTSTVSVGMNIRNTTDLTTTTVTAVDSDTALTVADDIFVSGENYVIEQFKSANSVEFHNCGAFAHTSGLSFIGNTNHSHRLRFFGGEWFSDANSQIHVSYLSNPGCNVNMKFMGTSFRHTSGKTGISSINLNGAHDYCTFKATFDSVALTEGKVNVKRGAGVAKPGNVSFNGCDLDVVEIETNINDGLSIDNCLFDNESYIDATSCINLNVRNNTFKNLTANGIESKNTGCNDWNVQGNTFESTVSGTPIVIFDASANANILTINNKGVDDELRAMTGDYTLLIPDQNTHFTNGGAAGTVTLTLPEAIIDRGPYTLTRTAGQLFRLDPKGTNIIRGGGAGKYLELDTTGESVTVKCLITGTWDVVAVNGTMSFEP